MAAPKGNEFWRVKSTAGRKKIFETPEIMWKAAVEYFIYTDTHPDYRAEWKDGAIRYLPVRVPYTMGTLTLFLHVDEAYFRQFKLDKNRCTEGFATVITAIEQTVREQKFKGAANGFFNANIISRDLGLIDRTINDNRNYNSIPLDKEEVQKLSKDLDNEV